MTIHEKHMEYVDKVNNSKTQAEYWHASGELHGFREGLRAAGVEPDLIACDLTQFERGHENRPMCCGVFNDWSPNDQAQRPPPETPGRLQKSRPNYLNRPPAQRGGRFAQRSLSVIICRDAVGDLDSSEPEPHL